MAAVFAELSGSENGLGHLLQQSIPQLETARAYAAVVVLAALAVLLLLRPRPRRAPRGAVGPPTKGPRPMIPRPVRAAVLLLALSVTAVTLTACGAKKDTTTTGGGLQHIDLMLDYIPNADHAAVYAAQDIGAFRAAGLDVAIRVPSDAAAPLKLVAAGKADVAISYEPELLLARDKGMRVASFGAVIQKPLTSIMSLNGKVKAPKDLAHKKVGTAGIPYQAAYLKTIVEQANINPKTVHEVNVGFNLEQAMLSKKVDATLGAFWNVEGVDLQRGTSTRPS